MDEISERSLESRFFLNVFHQEFLTHAFFLHKIKNRYNFLISVVDDKELIGDLISKRNRVDELATYFKSTFELSYATYSLEEYNNSNTLDRLESLTFVEVMHVLQNYDEVLKTQTFDGEKIFILRNRVKDVNLQATNSKEATDVQKPLYELIVKMEHLFNLLDCVQETYTCAYLDLCIKHSDILDHRTTLFYF